jgi:hypothetical protein
MYFGEHLNGIFDKLISRLEIDPTMESINFYEKDEKSSLLYICYKGKFKDLNELRIIFN